MMNRLKKEGACQFSVFSLYVICRFIHFQTDQVVDFYELYPH